jgi:aryl-alcohol dehydrogenase-like predicted oxidoreductase
MIEKRQFGKTGHESTRTLFGAAALGKVSQEEADRTLELLFRYGVNHLDVAASYGKGVAETRIGAWMPEHRDRFFLATKTGMRTYDEAKAELDESLKRLQVEFVDLIQLHNLTDEEGWATAMGPKGALKALEEAKQEGLVRHIGVTGHGLAAPAMHLKSLERYPFASVLLPLNYLMMKNAEYARGFNELQAYCVEHDVAIQTIKSIARREWPDPEHRLRHTWYEPLEDTAAVDLAVRWVLAHENVFLNTVGDIQVLPKVLEAANDAGPKPSDEEMERLVAAQSMEALFPRKAVAS